MAVAVRSSSKADSTTGTAMAVSAPAGATTGDFVVVIAHANGQTTIADNNGATPFTIAPNFTNYKPNTTNGHTVTLFSRTIQAGDPSTYNFTSGASGRWALIAICFSGTSLDFDVAPNTANAANDDSASTGTINSPSITTGVANTIHTVFCGWDTSATGTITTPSGYTLLQNANSGGEPLHASYKAIASASATGAVSNVNTEFAAMIASSFSVKEDVAVSTLNLRMLMGMGT
jgi:hypothetical protein